MNKNQKLVQQQFINNEEAVIKRLKSVYKQSLKDIEGKAKALQKDIEKLDKLAKLPISDEEKEIILSRRRSKVYQKQYQEALKKQVGGIYDSMLKEEFKTISDYLNQCYEDGFIGTMFDLQGQGIPLCFPLDQEAMVRAVQLDSKISQGLYSRLGEDVSLLKKKITAQVSRGISTGMSFEQVAKQLAGYTNIGYNNAIRIARTEGHRIQVQSGMDACYKAKDMGADVVKQWDSTLDSSTRESHAKVDGEIRELDKEFSNGLMFPGDPSGGAAEVINCRCALLQRARWALDEDELKTLQERAEFFGIDKSDSFEDFKKKYLKMAEQESAVEEIKGALDFGYGDFTDDDYIKWMNDYDAHNSGVHLSAEELKVIDDYTEGSFIRLNDVGRYSDAELLKKGYTADEIAIARKRAATLDGALSKYDLDTDIVTHRFERDVSWLTGKGNDIADLEALIGKEYTAKGFTSSGMLPNRFRFTGGKKDAVHFEIVTPKGTNGAFLSMSKKGENEFLYNRNTRFKILDGGERVVKERKYNLKTGMFDEIDVTERFLKVQVIPDELTKIVNSDIILPKKFIPVKDMKEAKTRFSNALGIPEEKINLGRMKPDLASQYLEGVERFTADFPMLKKYYGTLGTKMGNSSTLGLNKLTGTYVEKNGVRHIKYSAELHLKNPQDVSKMMSIYERISQNGEGYANSTPLSTAIHELVHGIDKAITLKRQGAFDESGLNGLVYGANHGLATSGVSRKIIKQVREEMFGTQYGKEVAEATRYLGRYARTSPTEELAEAISYEYVNPSNPYSARILELFKEEVKGAFGQ